MSLLLFFITCTTYISIIIIQSLVIINTKIMEIIDEGKRKKNDRKDQKEQPAKNNFIVTAFVFIHTV